MNGFLEPLALENSIFDLPTDEAQRFGRKMQSITDCVLHDTSAAFLCEKSTAEIKERLDGHFQETKDLCTKLFLSYVNAPSSTNKESPKCTVAQTREISFVDTTHLPDKFNDDTCEPLEKHIIVPFQDNDRVWRGYHGTVLDRIDEYRYRVECDDGDAAIVTIDLINRMEISKYKFTKRKKDTGDGFILSKGDIPKENDILPVLIP